MLRSFVLGVCLVCLTLGMGRAEEPSLHQQPPEIERAADWLRYEERSASEQVLRQLERASGKGEPDRGLPLCDDNSLVPPPHEVQTLTTEAGLPQSEREFLTQQRWARMPAFEIFEDPLPSPMTLGHPAICRGDCCAETAKTTGAPTLRRWYSVAQATPAVATVSDATPEEAFSNLTVPTPLADPAAMVVQLFEKLQASEDRAAEANRRLAEAQAELSIRRQAPPAPPAQYAVAPTPIVTLQMQCFEIDLDALAESDVELTGVCKHELSQSGLAALVARGAFSSCCSSKAACGAEQSGCTTCSTCDAEKRAPVAAPAAPANETCCRDSHQFVKDAERLAELVDEMKRAGVLRHVSHPRLMTRSGETAKMVVGRQVSYTPAGSEAHQKVQHTEFCNAGTQIEVKPVVTPDITGGGTVQVELRAQWSAIDKAASRENGRPVVDRRAVESIVELPAGKTAIVAGLVEGQERTESDDPRAHGRSEFVVLITPRLAMPLASTPAGEALR